MKRGVACRMACRHKFRMLSTKERLPRRRRCWVHTYIFGSVIFQSQVSVPTFSNIGATVQLMRLAPLSFSGMVPVHS